MPGKKELNTRANKIIRVKPEFSGLVTYIH